MIEICSGGWLVVSHLDFGQENEQRKFKKVGARHGNPEHRPDSTHRHTHTNKEIWLAKFMILRTRFCPQTKPAIVQLVCVSPSLLTVSHIKMIPQVLVAFLLLNILCFFLFAYVFSLGRLFKWQMFPALPLFILKLQFCR